MQSNKQVSYYIIIAMEAVDVSCKCHVGGVQQANPASTKLLYALFLIHTQSQFMNMQYLYWQC